MDDNIKSLIAELRAEQRDMTVIGESGYALFTGRAIDALEQQAATIARMREDKTTAIAALQWLADEFVKCYPIYYYAEPWAHDRNVALKHAREVIAASQASKEPT